ncbi:hypothetical protein Tco_0792992 [Tanacetum coccineum]
MTLDIHNWSSFAHQELLKIIKDEIYPIVNQVDARVQNFKIQFLKEVAKFFRDFKSLANEADASLAKHKALEFEIECLWREIVSQDIMFIVQNPTIVETSDLQTELERTKERFENYIIKKENEYAKLWNDWYKKCEECKYDKILYNKAYNDMQQKIERLQAQLGDLKGKSKDTSCVSNTLDHLSQKLENENLAIRNDKSEVICAMCKQCLITYNHDVCVLNYVNGMNSRNANQSENVSNVANQKKHKPKVRKSKKLESKERLASHTPSKPRSCLRWSPTGRFSDLKGKIIESSKFECQSDCSNVVPADSSSNIPADYVSAGHVLVPADRDRIC